MRKILYLLTVLLIITFVQNSDACVGRLLYLGVTNNPHEQLLAEVMSIFIKERTGSTVKILLFNNSRDLYNAVKQGQVNMIIENTDHAKDILTKPKETSVKMTYEIVKNEYRKKLNLTWFRPFGEKPLYAPVLTVETLTNYPALPRLLNKLAGVLGNQTCVKLFNTLKSGDMPKK